MQLKLGKYGGGDTLSSDQPLTGYNRPPVFSL
jgi:hypothetical protein